MSKVFKVHKTKNYTIMSNYHLRDERLSLKAKGLLSVIFSLPDDWNYSIGGLTAICKEGSTAVEAALKELKAYGYIVVEKKLPNTTESGRFEYEYNIYEYPCDKIVDGSSQGTSSQPPEKQAKEKQEVENLPLENLPLYKDKDKLNKDKLITDNKSINQYSRQFINDQIDYNALIINHPLEIDRIDELSNLIYDVVNSSKKYIRIGGENKPCEVVKSNYLKLNMFHIEYVLQCLQETTTEIHNIKNYLLTALYNSILTIGNYYSQAVNHDLNRRDDDD